MTKAPEDVLKECKIKKPPVPVQDIARSYGIEICELRGSTDIFGAILRTNKKVLIAINPAQHPNRQRFTIAHELGHYFCHPNEAEHVDRDFRISWRNLDSSKGVNWKEIEANRFAAALLVPEEFLQRDLTRVSHFDQSTITHLASRYKVSPVAMKFRLVNLGLIAAEFGGAA
jgi:Zn-dependent peptidase ImmA (M78 family)